jgi:hypothetical protein
MTKIIPPLTKAFFDSDLIASRLSLFIAESCWAIMLWWPGDTFIRPTYHGMAWLMSEFWWAILFTASAFAQLSVIVLQCYETRFGRRFAAINAMVWIYCVVSMLWSVYPPPAAIGGEVALMLSAFWIWVRPMVIKRGERLAEQ